MSQSDTASTTSTLVNPPLSSQRNSKIGKPTANQGYTTQRDTNLSYAVCKAQEASQLSYIIIYDRKKARNIVGRYDGSGFDANDVITNTCYMDWWTKERLCDCIEVSEKTAKFVIEDMARYVYVQGNNDAFTFDLFDKSSVTVRVRGGKYDAVDDDTGFVYASMKQSVKHAVPLMGHKYAALDLPQIDDLSDADMTLITCVMLYIEARLRNLHHFTRNVKRRNMKTSGDTALFMGGQNWAEQYGEKAVK